MTQFAEALRTVIHLAKPPTQKALAGQAGIDPAHLNRAVNGTFAPTPALVGRLCATLPPNQAKLLLHAYLQDIAATALAVEKPANFSGKWRMPKVTLQIDVNVRA